MFVIKKTVYTYSIIKLTLQREFIYNQTLRTIHTITYILFLIKVSSNKQGLKKLISSFYINMDFYLLPKDTVFKKIIVDILKKGRCSIPLCI